MNSLGNITFWLTPLVSYANTELFGSHRWSLTSMFQAFHLRGLTTPFLLRPHTLIIFHFLCLNCETLIGRRSKYDLTTHSPTLMMDDHTHAHTPNIMRCPCAYAMLMPLHVLMLHVCCTLHDPFLSVVLHVKNIYRKHISSPYIMPIYIDNISSILAFINP